MNDQWKNVIITKISAAVYVAPNTGKHIHKDRSYHGLVLNDANSVKDYDFVTVDVEGERRTRWYDVQVRVHKDFRLEMHVDTDDANAVGIGNGYKVKIVKE